MTRIITALTIFAIAALAACTHNDGDIGPWFGTWQVTAIEVDGSPDTAYDGTVIMKFQGSVLSTMIHNPEHSPTSFFAQWSCADGVMTIIIPRDETSGIAPGLGLPWLPELHLDVVSSLSGSASLRWTDPESGSTRLFTLKKLY